MRDVNVRKTRTVKRGSIKKIESGQVVVVSLGVAPRRDERPSTRADVGQREGLLAHGHLISARTVPRPPLSSLHGDPDVPTALPSGENAGALEGL